MILGSGASLAAFPTGEKRGRRLPVMRDFIEVLDLGPILAGHGIAHTGADFESLYSELAADGRHFRCVTELEAAVHEYFSRLELPDEPTLYDRLVLSLRPKDVVITFNWDPFLWAALNRNAIHARGPQAIFLHGNVAVGYCTHHQPASLRSIGKPCCKCGRSVEATRLLFPVREKNYQRSAPIAAGWRDAQRALTNAYVLTIFGYGAPTTDVEAVALLKAAWGDPEDRVMEEVEIIHRVGADTTELLRKWKPFICRDHFQFHSSFYASAAGMLSRRSVESLMGAHQDCIPYEERPLPQTAGWKALREWFRPLIDQELREEFQPLAE